MKRRGFLTAAGLGAISATAGCLGGLGSSDDPTADPETVVAEYYYLVDELGGPDDVDDGFLSDLRDISHSASPVPELFEESPEDVEIDDTSLETVDTEIVDEGVDEERLRDDLLIEFFIDDDDVIADIAAENRLVEATPTVEGEDEDDTQEWLVAPEDGDWLLVF